LQRSTDRILTTHSGSLLRPLPVLKLMKEIDAHRRNPEEGDFDAIVTAAVDEVVEQQVRMGVDIPGDGDMGRLGYGRYISQRLGEFEPRELEPGEGYEGSSPGEVAKFPEYYRIYDYQNRYWWMDPEIDLSELPHHYGNPQRFRVTGPVKYIGQGAIKNETRRLKAAADRLGVAEAFLTCTVPSAAGLRHTKGVLDHYPSEEAFLYAVADALREEYLAVVDAGLILQVDYPGIERGNRADMGVEALNYALRDIPEEKIRLHYCSGSSLRPHTNNPSLKEAVVPVLFKVRAQAYQIEGANPRHAHEWMIWKDVKLPEGKILMPGVISHNYQVVEHPELVAWRIENFASVVGKENVIPGIDCGFSQFWDHRRTHPEVQWAKFQSLVEGAAIASKKLWS
jgi:5-methyltetrahydropteroyltriglutamate--homocysteine methyltransferase